MYDKEALKRLISKKGPKGALLILSSPQLPEQIKKELSKDGLFDNKGSLNVELFLSLT